MHVAIDVSGQMGSNISAYPSLYFTHPHILAND